MLESNYNHIGPESLAKSGHWWFFLNVTDIYMINEIINNNGVNVHDVTIDLFDVKFFGTREIIINTISAIF